MSHGHVNPRPDGAVARCGGPAICSVCALELAQSTTANCEKCGGTGTYPVAYLFAAPHPTVEIIQCSACQGMGRAAKDEVRP